ncbi:MAG: trypsin-like peptidase domain-containing protein [Planctomycetes bacterium]|nr:trypsin-like peptidase domain-containing protein [Planctomycetota bacterium]
MIRSATLLLTAVLLTALGAGPLAAQGDGYAFDEREPGTPLEAMIAAKLPSLVKVHGASGLRTIVPYATGVIVSTEGHILTLDLVMVQAGQTRVVLADGSVHMAELLPPDTRLGVRLLKIDPREVHIPLLPLELADTVPENGTFVFSIGNAFRLAEFSEKLSVTFGVVSATASTGLRYQLSDLDYDGQLILTDAANNPGHYGGGLFTLDGRLVGLNARIVESTETNTLVNAAIPAADLRDYVARWTGTGPVVVTPEDESAVPAVQGYHGIVLFDQGGRRSPPAYVERVRRRSPADALGLRPDDLIVRVGQQTIRSCKEFEEAMAGLAPGAQVELTYKRGDDVLRGTLVLTEPPR